MRERKAETRWKDTVVCPTFADRQRSILEPWETKKEEEKDTERKRAVADAVTVEL